MKKIYLLPILLFSLSSVAQPPTYNSSFYSEGKKVFIYTDFFDDKLKINPGTAGENKTWSYTTLPTTLAAKAEFVSPSSLTKFADYPSALFAGKTTLYLGELEIDLESYFKKDKGGVYSLGQYTSNPLLADDNDVNILPELVLPSGLAFNASVSHTKQESVEDDEVTQLYTYDAYGKLTTPAGTFDAIRFKVEDDGVISYQWINVLDGAVLLQCEGDGSEPQFSSYAPITNNEKANTLANSSLLVSPNPVVPSSVASFELSKTSNVAINIMDAAGREVANIANSSYSTGKHSLSLAEYNLEKGVYFIVMNKEGEKLTRKFTVQ